MKRMGSGGQAAFDEVDVAKKPLAKELGRGNIGLSIRLWRILTAQDFDMGNVG